MDGHPLNLAHQQHRRADAHLVNNRYDEAMQCHQNAAELLLDAMKSTGSSAAIESITLQHSYHLKQKDFIKNKKEQYSRVKKAMENMKLGKDPYLNLPGNESSKLQVAIYKTINETDSLLQILSNNKDTLADQGLLRDNLVMKNDTLDGKRTDKTQQMVVEELQILSQSLHALVEQLVLQVEVLKDENMTLKDRISYLEKERVKYLNLPSVHDLVERTNIQAGQLYGDLIKRVPESMELDRAMIERPSSQPHFDLSALKDD